MLTLEQLRTQYKPQILELAKKHGVENIRVFGSVARDWITGILVVLEKNTGK